MELRVHGNLPDNIYEEQLCTISDISDGKSYCWKWDMERIEINYVGLNYYFNDDDFYNPLYYTIKISLITVTTLLGITLILGKKYYRRNNIRSN